MRFENIQSIIKTTHLVWVGTLVQIDGLEHVSLLASDGFTSSQKVLDVLHLFEGHLLLVDLLHRSSFDAVDQLAQDDAALQRWSNVAKSFHLLRMDRKRIGNNSKLGLRGWG